MVPLNDSDLRRWRKSERFYQRLAEELHAKLQREKSLHLYAPLADAYFNLGKLDDAIALLRSVLLSMPSNRSARILLAQALLKRREKSDRAEARSILIEVAGRWPDSPAANGLLAAIFASEGEHQKASDVFSRLIVYYPDSKYILSQARVYQDAAARSKKESAFKDPLRERRLRGDAGAGSRRSQAGFRSPSTERFERLFRTHDTKRLFARDGAARASSSEATPALDPSSLGASKPVKKSARPQRAPTSAIDRLEGLLRAIENLRRADLRAK